MNANEARAIEPRPSRGFQLGLIVGGVQKAGTTSLAAYLGEHPQLIAPRRKELHLFDDEKLDWEQPDFSAYARQFAERGEDRFPFDVTPIYLFWPPSLARIKAHNPGAKLIFIFRDPIERAFSHWRMERLRKAETLSFPAAIREGRARLDRRSPLERPWRVFSYVERGFYHEQLTRLFALFPREQILLLRSEDLANRPASVLGEISRFLQIAAFADATPRREHISAEDGFVLERDDIDYLRSLFRDDVAQFSARSGLAVDGWLTMR